MSLISVREYYREQAGKVYRKKDGTTFKVYSPQDKAKKYASDLRNGYDMISGKLLTKEEKFWRCGYLTARKHNAEQYKKNKAANYSRKNK